LILLQNSKDDNLRKSKKKDILDFSYLTSDSKQQLESKVFSTGIYDEGRCTKK